MTFNQQSEVFNPL